MRKLQILLLAMAFIVTAAPVYADDSVEDPIADGELFGQIRYRYEHVDQDGFTNNAKASITRANIGFKSGTFSDFQALGELQVVGNIGADDYNDTVNGNGAFPVVMEPEATEINRLWLSWSGLPDTTIKAGRQNININNERFISSIDWRQNDQNYDAITVENKSIDDVKLTYGYVSNVNRFLGDDSPVGDLDSQIHIANAQYRHAEWLKIAAYAFWVDFERAAALSHKMYGVRARGDIPVSERVSLTYEVEAARQSDHADRPANYEEDYHRIVPGVEGYGVRLQAGYEKLGGNGTNSVIVPLSHWQRFNGRVEKFRATPAAGLEDKFVKAQYKVISNNKWLNGTTLEADYHNFDGDSSGDFGSEIDLSIEKKFKTPENPVTDSIGVLLQYGSYNAEDAPRTDTDVVWFQLTVDF